MAAPIWALKLLYGCTAFAQMLLLRFVTTYFFHMGLDQISIGVLQAVRPAAAFTGELCWAWIVEHQGGFRRTVLSANVVGVTLFACIPLVGADFVTILILYGAASFCVTWMGLRDSRVLATLKAQGCDDGEFGRIRKFAAVGWGASGLISGPLQDAIGREAMFGTFVVFQAFAMLIIAFLPLDEPAAKQEEDLKTPSEANGRQGFFAFLRTGWILLFFGNLLAYGVCASAVETYLFVYLLKDFPAANDTLIGTTLAMMTLTELPVFHFADKILSFGFVRVFTACHWIFALRCVLYAILPQAHPWLVLAIEPLHGLTFAAMWASAVDFGRKYAPEGKAARFQALTSGLYFQLAFGLGALVWGPVMKSTGFPRGYCCCAALVAVWSAFYNAAQCRLTARGDSGDGLSEGLLKS